MSFTTFDIGDCVMIRMPATFGAGHSVVSPHFGVQLILLRSFQLPQILAAVSAGLVNVGNARFF